MNTPIVVSIVVALLSAPAITEAADGKAMSRKDEIAGAGLGVLVGGAIGGPPGALLGTIVGGGILGNVMGIQRHNRDLEFEVGTMRTAMRELATDKDSRIAVLEAEIAHLESSRVPAVVIESPSSVDLPIQFRTASSEIESHYDRRLDEVAAMLKADPGLTIYLAGHADRRGTSDYNMDLSEARVAEVSRALEARGVASTQIRARAYGESRPLRSEQDWEGDFFDRRVVLTVDGPTTNEIVTR